MPSPAVPDRRIAPLVGLDQRKQSRPQPRIKVRCPLPATNRTAEPPQQNLPDSSSATPRETVPTPTPGRGNDETNPTMPRRQCFRPYGQPTLTLIEMWQQHLELRRQDVLGPLRSPHTRTTRPTVGSHDLIPGKP